MPKKTAERMRLTERNEARQRTRHSLILFEHYDVDVCDPVVLIASLT